MSFENKVILITGASSGIGAACAEYFAQKGALLALVGRNAIKFKAVVDRIKQIGVTNEPLVILADVSIDYERIINETIDKYNRLDILINNAGFGVPGTLQTTTVENFDEIMATNVRGVFLLTQLATSHLIASKGNVVNVSSVCGLRPFNGFLSYCMSKAALDQFTKCTALELAAKGVRVNSVNPGGVLTDFLTRAGIPEDKQKELWEHNTKMHPIGRIGEPMEIATAIAYLASDDANFVTGTCLVIDGGVLINSPQ